MKRLGKSLLTISILAICMAGLVLAIAPMDGNLFKNPSFEDVQEPNQFGQAFLNWRGWVYDKPARLAIGTVARTGKYSYELIGDQGGKVRLQSDKLKLEPGRYRVQLYIRGLSVGLGQYGRPMDFSVGFDNKFPVLKKSGTFGWTPVTYVFEIQHPIENFQLLVGLLGSGWLWIDDVSLTKVGDSVDLTKEPVIGKEEIPISSPGSIKSDALHCPECGYLNNRDWEKCFACGHELKNDSQSSLPLVKVIADFEDGKPGIVQGGKITTENAPQGRYALSAKDIISINKSQDWSGYDYFRFDILNPSDDPAPILVEMRDALSKGYWTRVNYDTIVPPGKSTITIPTDMYVGEKARPGRPLVRDKIKSLFISPKGKQLVFDNIRLERLDTSSVLFDELQAFDFGTIDSPVMEGYRQITTSMTYEPGRGFGWDKAELWKGFNAMQPDALFQDFICPRSGAFRVDLPNGRYHVIMNIDSPGGYWGEVQTYQRRKVVANGATVVDEKMDIDSFTRRYFRNSVKEDLPGVDAFKEYVQQTFNIKEFDVDVSDGRLELKFQGEGFAISLSSLVIYPVDKAGQGKKFWDWTTERRKIQFDDYFKQVMPKRTGTVPPTKDYTLFSRSFMKPVNAFDGPLAGESLTDQGLSVTVARGEETPVTFSVQPSGDLGEIDLVVSDLKKGVKTLPAGVLNPGWVDFRISRVTMEGSVFTVKPRYWHPVPAPDAPGVTRTFWLRVKVPDGVEPGAYNGTISIRPRKGVGKSIPVTVNVLPFALDPITDVAVGPWGSSINLPWYGKDTKATEWNWQMFGKSLDVLKDAGCTSFSGVPHLKATAAGGRVKLDTSLADKEMALIRSKGFTQLLSSYGVDNLLGYRMRGYDSGPDMISAKAAGFVDAESFLKTLYSEIDEHAVKNNWLPVAWNLCDEPLGDASRGAALNALAHRKAATGLKLTTFMGATSMEGNDPKNPHFNLVQALLLPSLNKHDESSLKVIQDAGNRFSYYNDATRWTYGRYMKMLVLKYNLALRLSWHFNVTAGDPYYALDCREDDYCWFNSDAKQTMVPSVSFLGQILSGLNDYRYLSTLQRLLKEKPNHPAVGKARKVLDSLMELKPGKDHLEPSDVLVFERDRKLVVDAIEALLAH